MDVTSDYSYMYSNSVLSPSKSSTQPEDRTAAASRTGYRAALHSVRKNVITKKPIAPMPPTPPKVYKVNPVDFRDVVQRLTGLQPSRLREVAPPPLSLSGGGFHAAEAEMPRKPALDGSCSGAASPMGFNLSLSPASMAWCSSVLLSPGTLSS